MNNSQSQNRMSGVNIQSKIVLLSAATDGIVAFWDISSFYTNLVNSKEAQNQAQSDDLDAQLTSNDQVTVTEKPKLTHFFSLCQHQSGINSLSIHKYGKNFTCKLTICLVSHRICKIALY